MEGKISSSGCTGERVVRRVEAPGVTPVFLTCIAGCFWCCSLKIINTRLQLDPSGVLMCWQMHIAVLVPTVVCGHSLYTDMSSGLWIPG